MLCGAREKPQAFLGRDGEAGMRFKLLLTMLANGLLAGAVWAQKPPLLPEKDVAALANELSGETAKRNLEVIATFHRQRGSRGFHLAAELVAERARAYGLSDVQILEFPADGKIFYGTQRSRPAWDAEVGELWEVKAKPTRRKSEVTGRDEYPLGFGDEKLASYETEPVVLAEDSESSDVTAELVDVGSGTSESDYAGRDVKGKIVLVGAQPGAVQDLAVGKFGPAGIVSYAQNQKTAWWGEDENLIRWGHLDTFSPNKTFAFMVSLKTARGMRERLAHGEKITLHAVVKAGQHAGNYEVVTATIPGADRKLKEKLIAEGELARPARTMRFIWPPEIEGTLALLNGKPELRKRIRAAVHMDMVGGGPETKAVFHVTRGPMSLPSFVHDVAWAFAEFVNEESYKFAATWKAEYPFLAPEGGKEPLRAEYSAYTMGSDHDVYQDSSFGIPAIYMNDWPDRYIHTNFDTAANIDATKLKRAAFIGAASGYFLAGMREDQRKEATEVVAAGSYLRMHMRMTRQRDESTFDACVGFKELQDDEQTTVYSVARFLGEEPRHHGRFSGKDQDCHESLKDQAPGNAKPMFQRNPAVRGPLAVFGYDYFGEHAKAVGVAEPKLLSYEGLRGGGEEYAYEVLNFVDGKRNVQEIRDAVSAEYGPVPLELVAEYLRALEKIGVVSEVK